MTRYNLLCRKVVGTRVTWVREWYDTPIALMHAFREQCHQGYWDTVDGGPVEVQPTPRRTLASGGRNVRPVQLTLRE